MRRVVRQAEDLDAMTSDRPYRKGLPFEAAKAEIARMAGSQFDPVAVGAFLAEEAILRNMVLLKCGETQLDPETALAMARD